MKCLIVVIRTLETNQSPWDLVKIELVTPGSADRQVSALGYVTDCATQPVGIYRTYTVFMSISFHFAWSYGTLESIRCILLLVIKIDFQAGHNQCLNIDKQV